MDRKLPENARTVGAHLVKRLEGLKSLGVIGEIRGKGLLIGVEFVKDPATKRAFPPEVKFGLRVGKRCLHNGLLLRFDPHWLAFAPPLIVTESDIDQMVAILEKSIREVLQEL